MHQRRHHNRHSLRIAMLAVTVVVAVMVSTRARPVEGAVEVGLQPENLVIVVNDRVPASVELGRYYAEQRGVPEENICHIQTETGEVIDRTGFDETIRDPIREFLDRRLGQMRVELPEGELVLRLAEKEVRCLVTTWGVPLKISGHIDTKTMYKSMAAAVDSELALLPQRKHILNGALSNPYFGRSAAFDDALARRMLLVCRLDGPTPETVRRMIDDALWAEKHGLRGRAYFDTRSIAADGYKMGDEWILAARETIARTALPTHTDRGPQVIPMAHPMPEAVFYLGWYASAVAGPISRDDFRFERGAVAYHLHSFAAWSVRTATERWAGPLLDRGAACTFGAVYEPFLFGTPHLDILTDRLVRGYTFAEAGYMAQKQLSWMVTFLGDPLYRPFLADPRPPEGPEPPPLTDAPTGGRDHDTPER